MLLKPKNNSIVPSQGRVSDFCFFLYMCFLVDFFIHLSARFPGLGVFRPTLLLIVLISISIFLQRDKIPKDNSNSIYAAMIGFLAYLIISLPVVEFQGSVLRKNGAEFIKVIVFFFFTAFIVDDVTRLKKIVFVFIFCQVFRVLEPLYLHVTEGYWGSATYIGGGEFASRLSGAPSDVINPNELGFVIVTVIPYLHYLLFSNGKFRSAIYFLLMPLLLYALILTMSRGALLALFVVAWMIFKEANRKFVLLAAGAIIVIAGWSVMTPIQKDRYLSLISSDTRSSATASGRLKGMTHEFSLGLERPIVGHGVGTTAEAKYHKYGKTQASHNFYAELLIEVGLIGMVMFFRVLMRIYKRFKDNVDTIEKMNLPRDSFYSRLNKALTAIFWMYIVYSTNYWGLSVYYWYFFGGLAVVFGRILDSNRAKNGGPFKKSVPSGKVTI